MWGIPFGKHTKSYWKLPCIVDWPIKDGDFPVCKMLLYQRVQKQGIEILFPQDLPSRRCRSRYNTSTWQYQYIKLLPLGRSGGNHLAFFVGRKMLPCGKHTKNYIERSTIFKFGKSTISIIGQFSIVFCMFTRHYWFDGLTPGVGSFLSWEKLWIFTKILEK